MCAWVACFGRVTVAGRCWRGHVCSVWYTNIKYTQKSSKKDAAPLLPLHDPSSDKAGKE